MSCDALKTEVKSVENSIRGQESIIHSREQTKTMASLNKPFTPTVGDPNWLDVTGSLLQSLSDAMSTQFDSDLGKERDDLSTLQERRAHLVAIHNSRCI